MGWSYGAVGATGSKHLWAARTQTISASPACSATPRTSTISMPVVPLCPQPMACCSPAAARWPTANWIAYTTGYTVDTTANPIQDISFYAGSAANGAVIPGFRIAVQIDGNWYATSQVFANTVAVAVCRQFQHPSTTGYLHLDNRRQCLGNFDLRPWYLSGARQHFDIAPSRRQHHRLRAVF